jgi:hypothetical protein
MEMEGEVSINVVAVLVPEESTAEALWAGMPAPLATLLLIISSSLFSATFVDCC